MIRLILYFALIAGVAIGLAWVADRPGSVSVQWLGYDLRTSVFIGALVLIVFFAALVLAVWLGILTWTAPRRIARRLERRKRRLGHEALRRGIFAAGAGDRLATLKAGAVAKRNIPEEPLTLLLEAQSAQLNEDAIASRQAFERMLERPEMVELGLRGLYIEAKKAGEQDAAKQFAERALAANPSLTWSSAALLDMQCRDGDWRAALKTLGIAKQNRHLSKAEADKRRAILLTALATELEDVQQSKALAYAVEAYGLNPSLIPAAVIAGRVLAAQGNVSRATKLIGQAWRVTPHPDLALIYAHARTGDSPKDRLARVKTLAASGPENIEADIAVAVAAIEANEWSTARSVLDKHLGNSPPARICRLMARIEAGENRDAGRAREWLAKAARGAPDPMWVASDGSVSSEWRPMSPASGMLEVFEWKTPPAPAADHADELIAEMSALDMQRVEIVAPASEKAEASEMPAGAPADRETRAERQDLQLEQARPERRSSPAEIVDYSEPVRIVDSEFRVLEGAQIVPEDEVKAIAATPREAPELVKAAVPAKLKPESRKPKIFIPGPAPDDPGPRAPEGEDDSTILSRFRRPT